MSYGVLKKSAVATLSITTGAALCSCGTVALESEVAACRASEQRRVVDARFLEVVFKDGRSSRLLSTEVRLDPSSKSYIIRCYDGDDVTLPTNTVKAILYRGTFTQPR